MNDAPDPTVPTGPDQTTAASSNASRLWRSIWRTHFYAGVIAGPILVLFALTGLVILYTDVIQGASDDGLRTVTPGSTVISLDDQRAAVQERYPQLTVSGVTPPKAADRSTQFATTDADGVAVSVFVNPYTGTVLGRETDGGGIVGLANRLHGSLNTDSVTVKVPSLAGIVGDEPLWQDVAVGDLLLEVFAGWGLILAFTGIVVWWPRKKGAAKPRLVPRWSKAGRARWRDVHAVAGSILGVMLVFFVATGLPWSGSWGSSWAFVASKATPNDKYFWGDEAPASTAATVGDLDRIGRRIPWATGLDAVPASDGGGHHHHGGGADDAASAPADGSTGSGGAGAAGEAAARPATASLDLIRDAADAEGMLAGYSISFPADTTEGDRTTYGSFVVINPWPSDIANQKALYLDQFSGRTIGTSSAEDWGTLQWATELGVQTHMGTQFGLADRIVMTAACVAVIVSFLSAVMMWNKRRRRGTLGLPRRPADVRLQRNMGIVALVLAVVYPLWGLTLVLVLAADRFVVRRVPRLRRAFGMR